jgi:hypothetical protein
MKKVNFDVKLPAFVDRIVYVDNYGARPYCYTIEDASRNADAINRAINYISEKGGGTVVIPEGIWFTAPIEIKSDVELRIEKNAILKFSKDIDQYPLIITNYEGQECIRAKSPITAENAINIGITGGGVIDGSGDLWRPVKQFKLTDRQWEGTVRLCANLWNAGSQKHTIPEKTFHVKGVSNTDTVREFIYPMGQDVHLWSEWNPALYKLTMSSELKSGEDVMADHRQLNFGMRKFATNGKQFTINGTPTFLRGKHDGQVFPHQGYAPMNVDEWVKILRLLKDWGINHIRCHTWCPPEACFTACDIVGIYMLPELPHWGSVGRKAKVVQGDVEQKLEFMTTLLLI